MNGSGRISTYTLATGNSGDITIDARETINLDGKGRGNEIGGIFSSAFTGATNQQALATLERENSDRKAPVSLNNSPTPQIIEAQGWVKTGDGDVELVAAAPVVMEKSTTTITNCPVVAIRLLTL
ncbi:hypothetical protein NIES2101_08945 [Calothrix sp. HK-06]|nr:hypothetical protein NIES2101_08945 [Calothrix sp. HK-06]